MTKPEFEPIFPPGFHTIDLNQLDELFVTNFEDNSKRQTLVNQLRNFLNELSKINTNFEIWLDGSFTTLKIEPEDIDILVVYNANKLNLLPNDQKVIVNSLLGNRTATKIRYNIDVLICADDDVNNRSYWRGWFGYSRSEQPKGIAKFTYGDS
ncbi:hypothetical protein L1S35_05225 [Flavobacterium sp. AS60]|uniref:DUF6932 family protein n=1 Tax=Flavobacterium anseongense TaxID=2910677 RepID=UPI001F3BF473|nr:hypothetical protein [Flavobacterium sp. AS60]MCF6129066.1 hypothetical protein [Flavobacterium sp. AS60]